MNHRTQNLKELINFIITIKDFNDDTNKLLSEVDENSNRQLNDSQENTNVRHSVKRHKYWKKNHVEMKMELKNIIIQLENTVESLVSRMHLVKQNISTGR